MKTNTFHAGITTRSKLLLTLLFCFFCSPLLLAQSKLWTPTQKDAAKQANDLTPDIPDIENRTLFDLSLNKLLVSTRTAKQEGISVSVSTTIIDLPLPNGTFQQFKIWESALMKKGLAETFPNIKTYVIKGIDDPYATGRIMVSPYEFSAYFSSPQLGHEVFIRKVYKGDPYVYTSYYGTEDPTRTDDWYCGFEGEEATGSKHGNWSSIEKTLTTTATGSELHLFTLAISFPGATSEQQGYTTKAEAMAGILSFLSEINTVYERDVSIRFVLPEGQEQLIFLDDATDPYVGNGGGQATNESQVIQRDLIGIDNYDLGLVFVVGGCCAASKPSVCTGSRDFDFSRFR
ncbi:MAG: zinc-dependent metalloprotease family protein, partial [Bacteroidota bacterium]